MVKIFIKILILNICLVFVFMLAAVGANNIQPSDKIFIQIWMSRSELNKLKTCRIGSYVKLDKPNGEYYILPCSSVKETQ
jgi:hypothetical protein